MIQAIIMLTWVLDIIDLPQLSCLDTTYPINTLAWWLIWIFVIPLTGVNININK